MASFQKTVNADVLSVKTIFARGANNSLIPAFRVLATDGVGGTSWLTLSTLATGGAFHRIITDAGTFTADPSGATFTILDTPTAGLLSNPTASNSVFVYAKAFSQIDVSGSNTIKSYDAATKTIQSNITLVGTGGITIFADPQTNYITFDGGSYFSSISTASSYSFSELVVYSNLPYGSSDLNSNSSIILEANSPSTLLKFVGSDPINIRTDYSKNAIYFEIPSLSTGVLSSLFGEQKNISTNSFPRSEFCTFSTSLGVVPPIGLVQNGLSSLSTATFTTINSYSTSIGSIRVFQNGISTVYNATVSNLTSTTNSIDGEISSIYNIINTDYNIIRGSTFQTPYFWASTLITVAGFGNTAIPTPNSNFTSTIITYYPTYSSFYNKFADTQTFGRPFQPPVSTYNTSINFSNNQLYSNFSSANGQIFSTNVAVQGNFLFTINQVGKLVVDVKGALGLNYDSSDVLGPLTTYPRDSNFVQSTYTINVSPVEPHTVSYTFLKQNPDDYIRFSTSAVFPTYIFEEVNARFAPLFRSYGYNLEEPPLYTETTSLAFPFGFSTMSNLTGTDIQQLSSYLAVLSTAYTTGFNTTFPISSFGFTSMQLVEGTTNRIGNLYQTNLQLGQVSSFTSSFSASNLFGYTIGDADPGYKYTFQLYYGRQNTKENLVIDSIFNRDIVYDYAYTVYVSSFLYASSISSYNGYFEFLKCQNVQLCTINGTLPIFLAEFQEGISSVSSSVGTILSADMLSSMSSAYGTILSADMLSSLSSSYGIILGATDISSFSSALGISYSIDSLCTFSTSIGQTGGGGSGDVTKANLSTLSSAYADLRQSSTFSSIIRNLFTVASTLNVSTISTPWFNLLGNSFSTFSTNLGPVGPGDVVNINISTMSTTYGDLKEASTISTFIGNLALLNSTLVYNNSSFSSPWSSVLGQSLSSFSTTYADLKEASTLSSFIGNIFTLTSTINTNLSSFNSPISSITDTVLKLASTINYNLSSFVSPWSSILYQTLSSFSTTLGKIPPTSFSNLQINTSTLKVSSFEMAGLRQPYTQYGAGILNGSGSQTVTLSTSYGNANYGIQLTYLQASGAGNPSAIIRASNVASGTFNVLGDANYRFYWTTFGNLY